MVTQIKTVDKDGYEAVQVGFRDKKEKHTNKPEAGHFAKAGVTPKRHLAEFKSFETLPELDLYAHSRTLPGGRFCRRSRHKQG